MSDDLIKRMRSQEAVDGRPHEIEQLTDEAAALIEQQATRIAALEAKCALFAASLAQSEREVEERDVRIAALATVAPAVDAQPVAFVHKFELDQMLMGARSMTMAVTTPSGVYTTPLYTSAQSEGLRKAWQLIETAPKDGTEVLLIATRHSMLMPHPERIVGAYRNGWWSGPSTLSHVTHWMPLPEAPAALSQHTGEKE